MSDKELALLIHEMATMKTICEALVDETKSLRRELESIKSELRFNKNFATINKRTAVDADIII